MNINTQSTDNESSYSKSSLKSQCLVSTKHLKSLHPYDISVIKD